MIIESIVGISKKIMFMIIKIKPYPLYQMYISLDTKLNLIDIIIKRDVFVKSKHRHVFAS